jgi:arginyl-tRNA synthetase
LSEAKWQDYHFDRSIIITAGDILEYMKVVLKALSHFHPELADTTDHLTHGLIKMPGGEKMSSRTGKGLLADDILKAAREAAEAQDRHDEDIVLGAVKYSLLKSRIGGDIIFNPAESVSIEGNSGPYLQYALVRAKSILQKAADFESEAKVGQLEAGERSLAVQVGKYPEVFQKALEELSPHLICNYLYETAQVFNRFYENNRVVDDPRSGARLQLVRAYGNVLANGLHILGIPTPERM